MANVLAWKETEDGKVRIAPMPGGETQADRARRLTALFRRIGAPVHSWVVVQDNTLPTGNGETRNAWDISGGAVVLSLSRGKKAVRERLQAWAAGEIAVWRARWLSAQIAGDAAGVSAADAAIAEWSAMPTDPAIEAAQNIATLRTILQTARAKRTSEGEE